MVPTTGVLAVLLQCVQYRSPAAPSTTLADDCCDHTLVFAKHYYSALTITSCHL